MRRIRWLVLVLLVAISSTVLLIYQGQRARQQREAPPPPKSLPESESARAEDWIWENTRDGRPSVRVRARDFRQNADGTRIDLKGVELRMFAPDGQTYDRVRCEDAVFDQKTEILFSPGDVEITMGMPATPHSRPSGRLVTIKTSGVRYESNTGKAFTEKFASFVFDKGSGQSTGALYDPGLRELQMHNDVKLRWTGSDPAATPMDIEAASLLYKETSSEILLSTWSKFRRDTLAMEGGNAIVRLKEDVIESVDALQAKGTDIRPDRKTEYSANTLYIRFGEKGVLQSITGDGDAQLVSTSPTSETTVHSNRLDLEFTAQGNDSLLNKALATQKAVVESKPVAKPGVPPPDTRVLKSEVINLFMRPGGQEMDKVETDSPGHIDFLPNHPASKRRAIDASNMSMIYGSENRLKTFTAVDVTTRTENPPIKGKPQPPSLTSSKGMTAHFDEKTGSMAHLEQWENFRYEEGDRRARSERADFYGTSEEIVLLGKARVWDPTGSTDADRISIGQKTGEMKATGSVTSTRQPEQKKAKGGQQQDVAAGMMSGNEPIQAKAANMTTSQNNAVIVYEGKALLWQGANRINAEVIRIDRSKNRLEASRDVVTQFLDKNESKKGSTKFTVVRASSMDYDDNQHLAFYRGGVTLKRDGMTVTSRELRAWLTSGNDGSSLEKAFADGDVHVTQNTPTRTRTGQSEHAEFYAVEGKTVLSGGAPVFHDTVKGTTKGRKITYYSEDERLEVEGEERKPAESKLLRRPG